MEQRKNPTNLVFFLMFIAQKMFASLFLILKLKLGILSFSKCSLWTSSMRTPENLMVMKFPKPPLKTIESEAVTLEPKMHVFTSCPGYAVYAEVCKPPKTDLLHQNMKRSIQL